jgi:ABC-2 type transport system permease protein
VRAGRIIRDRLILVVVWRFHAVDGWTWRPLILLMGLSAVIRAIRSTFAGGVPTIPSLIQYGGFDTFLLRPVHRLLQVLTQPASSSVGADNLVAVPAFLAAIWYAGVHSSGTAVVLLTATAVGGVLMLLAVDIAVASQALWSGQSVEGGQVHRTLMYVQGQHPQYPLGVFPRLIRWAMTFLFPLAFISFFPARVLGTAVLPFPAPLRYGWLTLPRGMVMVTGAALLWTWGLRHYQSTGS